MKVLTCDGIQESSRVPIHDDGWDVAVLAPIKDPDALAFGIDAPSGRCATAISMSLETL